MGKLNPHKTGMGIGAFFAVMHAIWSLLVASGAAYSLINFYSKLHMVDMPFTIHGFSFSTAIGLIIVTAIIGYIIGGIFAYVWNWTMRM